MNINPNLAASTLAHFKFETLDSLIGESAGFNSVFADALSAESSSAAGNLLNLFIQGAAKSGPHAGRNMALADPESGYRMMSLINDKDLLYKAQYSELSRMGDAVRTMQQAGQSLGGISEASSNGDIRAGLQGFIGQYNDWMQGFNPDMQNGGLLAGTQAAQLSRYELEQSVKNRFNGADDGVHGLADLGINADPVNGSLSLDSARLAEMLASNRHGAVDAIREFSANFAKSASLLNADNNFIPNQLGNLDRAIHYIAANNTAWRAEFGTGNAAKPVGQTAQALAAYQRNFGA
ncbi:MAG TPA: flagellar filament capping protein FliD [Gallionella sp.]|nr:flagellar filament capping protein FliD [Gallionella sp.]